MKEFWNIIQLIFSGIGGWLGYFLGGCDGLLYALLAFVVIDYITGIMCAIADHSLSSEVGFKGICRKILIFLLVGIAHILDVLAAYFAQQSSSSTSLMKAFLFWKIQLILDFRYQKKSRSYWNSFTTVQKVRRNKTWLIQTVL